VPAADPDPVEEFLAQWCDAFVKADPRDRRSITETAAQCLDDAKRQGISEEQLNEVTGGDIAAYFMEIKREDVTGRRDKSR